MAVYGHCFEAPVERFGVGRTRKVWYTVIFLPHDFANTMHDPLPSRFRIEGEVNDYPITGAFIPAGDGRRYIILSPDLLKETGLQIGDLADVRFAIDDPDRVEIPPELAKALKENQDLNTAWQGLTPGRKRGISHFINTAKTLATRHRRLEEAQIVIIDFRGDFRKWQRARRTGA